MVLKVPESPEQREARLAANRIRSRKSYLKNKEKVAERRRKKYLENPQEWIRRGYENRKKKPEQYRATYRKWRAKNAELCRRRCREWYQRNLEEQRARLREKERLARLKDPEKLRERCREWMRNNPAEVSRARHKRKELMSKSAKNVKLISKWMVRCRKRKGIRCYYCSQPIFNKQIRFDHIVPLSKGGPHAIENLCCSCNPCNASKHAKLVSDWMKVGQLIFNI